MLNLIRILIKKNYRVFKALRRIIAFTGYYRRKGNIPISDRFWADRIETVIACPDNQHIPRVHNAGEIIGDTQVMHNGLKINVGSYYGDGNTVLLKRNRGVHEPQEEKIFAEVLALLPDDATMIELGSFWAFYSMTFLKAVPNGSCFLIEPDAHALISGKHNFRLNKLSGRFFNYAITNKASEGKPQGITIDKFISRQNIAHVNILHSDIQGHELEMLYGASHNLSTANIDFVFLSTHSNELHNQCKDYLTKVGYQILCDANLDQSYSWDGLIVGKHKGLRFPEALTISLRNDYSHK